MSARRDKARILRLLDGRFYGPVMWQSAEDIAWERIPPIGHEFGSPDYERLMEQDYLDVQTKVAEMVARCTAACLDNIDGFDANELSDAENVRVALQDLGHDVSLKVATTVWKEYSGALRASWIAGAETVKSAKDKLTFYSKLNTTSN